MTEEPKATETPLKPEVSADESLIDNPRQKVEEEVIAENLRVPDSPVDPIDKPEEKLDVKPEDKEVEPLSEVDRIKQAVQKRIDKVVAQKKTAEEELIAARAEIERLKSAQSSPTPPDKKDDAPPTIEQVEAYILKMAEEGNKKEEIAATRYLIKLEKEAAIKEVEDRQANIKREAEDRSRRENDALLDLAKDYIAYNDKGEVDMSHDLTLANQKGKLFQVAMALYNDPELHKLYYNDPDRPTALRRATADAYRELHQQGIIKTPKDDGLEAMRRNKRSLAEPDATEIEDVTSTGSNLLSDAEKVREEIKLRNQLRNSRKPSSR